MIWNKCPEGIFVGGDVLEFGVYAVAQVPKVSAYGRFHCIYRFYILMYKTGNVYLIYIVIYVAIMLNPKSISGCIKRSHLVSLR
jgi:hypothetical protein